MDGFLGVLGYGVSCKLQWDKNKFLLSDTPFRQKEHDKT